jgi:cyclophilin family peptidyl-prolyl cis-trans isomerase
MVSITFSGRHRELRSAATLETDAWYRNGPAPAIRHTAAAGVAMTTNALSCGAPANGMEPHPMRTPILLLSLALAAAPAWSADAPRVRLETSLGTLEVTLDADKAPQSVENFLAYVRAGHYDGTLFHRVIPGFMIQGGGFVEGMQQKPTRAPIVNEAGNGLKNLRGTLAMARTGVVDSATAQFFINVADNAFLDHKSQNPREFGYAVFGRVVDGMEVVDRIVAVPTGNVGPLQNVPQSPVKIVKATVVGEAPPAR